MTTQSTTSCRELVAEVLATLAACGVKEISVCPGSRNALFVQALKEDSRFSCYSWPEERSAAFFALGCAKGRDLPAAVVTTSGTAAGELLPAMMEAHYSCLPLVAVTADRPRRYRCSGAPQCAEQKGLFGTYASVALDLAAGEDCFLLDSWDKKSPAHLNICLEDPRSSTTDHPEAATWERVTGSDPVAPVADFLKGKRAPLVIVGPLAPHEREGVAQFLLHLGAPAYLEATSGLREDRRLGPHNVRCAEKLWERARRHGYPVDAVLRLGGVPTVRLWRDLDDDPELRRLPLLSVARLPFSGASRGVILHAAPSLLGKMEKSHSCADASAFLQADALRWERRCELFKSFPDAEASLIHELSKLIPTEAFIYLGNSLPIREWDMGASYTHPHGHVSASRGLNGIDGQLSTFLGMCSVGLPSWGIFGDLTFLYDLIAPWALMQRCGLAPQIVVINNGGGRIFAPFYHDDIFLNKHNLSFYSLAQMWGLHYEEWHKIPHSLSADWQVKAHLIELIPDVAASDALLLALI